MDELLGLGHCLTLDNNYSSPELADILVRQKTDVHGTLKLARKDLPKQIKKKRVEEFKNGKGRTLLAFKGMK